VAASQRYALTWLRTSDITRGYQFHDATAGAIVECQAIAFAQIFTIIVD
jgi:hypothetical protein